MPSIFITGGAAGIGLATAERFGRDGWTVGVYDVDADALAKVKADHPDFITGTLDVREPEQWAEALAEFTSRTGGTLDVLDNNAGILHEGQIDHITPDQIKRQIDIDALGVALGAQAAYPYLKKTPGAHLVNHRIGVGDLRPARHRGLLGDQVLRGGPDRGAGAFGRRLLDVARVDVPIP